jgi:transketolase
MALEPFAERFPDRFLNVGVAEQNMIGVATGLAEAGFVPFAYSIASFATMRPYEFIRNGPALHGLPVRVVGVGGGLEYGGNGVTHYALEDVAVMRAQPSMTVIVPADHRQAARSLSATAALPGPIYFRLGKDDTTAVEGLEGRFELGRLQVVRSGAEIAFVAMGPIATQAVGAAAQLAREGVQCAVAVVASVSPPPVDDLVRFLEARRLVFTVEAHYPNGGVGSLVSEVVAEHGLPCRVVRRAIASMPDVTVGGQAHMERRFGLAADQLADGVLQTLAAR